ncbi:MAG: 5-bromo-4-chloroindolyl phosphate hydrolysis family protein [Campylobacterota bacterium]|nr:5-bromo-4-chloroindolyl phosphate hydrolysis family protein [Campylobacterota bacterium]
MNSAKRYNPPKVESNMIKKGFLLYLFLIPLFLSVVVALFGMKFFAFIINIIAFLLFFAVLYLSKKGFAQEINYNQAKIAKAPKIQYKEFAAYLLGVATLYTAYIAGGKPLSYSLFWAALSIAGYWLYYGFDPRKDKIEDFGDISAELVVETFQEAQEKIDSIERDSQKIQDTLLSDKINLALDRAKAILDTIAEDPKDIRVARKFLIVYIDGVAKVTSSYTALEEEEIDPDTRERLLSLMDDVEVRFGKEMQRLKANNEFDLDVHIDVLKEQIKN